MGLGPPQDFAGAWLRPGDDGYDTARSVWNAMVDRKPAVIARCTGTPDVVAALRSARTAGLEIGVRCGGHSVLGLPVSDGGLMLDLTPMGGVRVDPERRLARVGGGALLGALDRATLPYGLATTAGNVSHTGVGGLTLGGGMGWLARRFGLSCDNVVAYELVTADGGVLRVDGSTDDLYWALRGGGGNFGVVTEFEFRLYPVDTRALVANVFLRPEEAADAMRGWRDLIGAVPREATLTAWVGTAGADGFLPPAMHHHPLAALGLVWTGDPARGRELVPALRDLGEPVAEQVREMRYLDLQCIEDDVQGHRFRRYWKGHYFREFPAPAVEAFLSRAGDEPDFLPSVSLQAYGGAIAEVPDGATAFSHRETLVEYVAAARWTDPAEDDRRIAAARGLAGGLAPYASGAYVNVLTDEGGDGVRRAYPEHKLARLRAVKDRYDPDNVFHLNQNIRPGTTS